jgi:hypothetical protein
MRAQHFDLVIHSRSRRPFAKSISTIIAASANGAPAADGAFASTMPLPEFRPSPCPQHAPNPALRITPACKGVTGC